MPTDSSMTIWVDADAVPREVKEIILRAAKRLGIETVLVANQRIHLPLNNPIVRAVRVEGGPDVADRYIAEHASRGDVAVSADIPLASALVDKGVEVLDHRGEAYTVENIGERLSVRNLMEAVRDTGVDTGGPRPYGEREKRAFANAFDRTLTRLRSRA
jgi:uncharacterized protein YaiI (UPF0178 family)